MTYQSSPMYPLIFPDQAKHLNRFGVQPLKANIVHHAKFESTTHGSHPSWREDAHKLALAKVQNTKNWQNHMLKEMPSVKGKRAYTSKRYSMHGGSDEILTADLINERIKKYGSYPAYEAWMLQEPMREEKAKRAAEDALIGQPFDFMAFGKAGDEAEAAVQATKAAKDKVKAQAQAQVDANTNLFEAPVDDQQYAADAQVATDAQNLQNYTENNFDINDPDQYKSKQIMYDYIGGRSAEMQDELDVLLKNRSGDYDEVMNASFYGVSPDRLFTPLPEVNTFGVDAAFADLASSLDIGDIKHSLGKITAIINSLMLNADKLPLDSLQTYVGVVRRGIQVALAMQNETFLSHTSGSLQTNKSILKSIIKELEGLGEFLQKFVSYAYRPLAERTSLLASIRKNLLAEVTKNSRWTISE